MFSTERSAQIAAVFARMHGGKINVLKLVKLIYLSDRRSMEIHGRPITYDRLVSMDYGPVPSRTLNLINGHDSDKWDKWMAGRANHMVVLKKTDFKRKDLDELSQADMEILEDVWREFGKMDQWELSNYTHENCPEWEDPNGSSLPIQERKIFESLGWKKGEARLAEEAIQDQRNLDKEFERA